MKADEVPGTLGDKKELEDYQKVFHETWNDPGDPVVAAHLPEREQIARLLAPYCAEVFNIDEKDIVFTFAPEHSIGARRGDGYIALCKNIFPEYHKGKKTLPFSDAIARQMRLQIGSDGMVRWGRGGECIVMMIRLSRWLANQEALAAVSAQNEAQYLPEGEHEGREGETTVKTTLEQKRIPLTPDFLDEPTIDPNRGEVEED